MSHTLVLGVGNTLLADEGAGVHAMRHFEQRANGVAGLAFLDAGTLSFTLAADIAGANNLLIFDAARFGAAAGSVRLFEGAAFDAFMRSGRRSVHEVGLGDLLDIARLEDCLPSNRALIGIEPDQFGWGDTPGRRVQAALPAATRIALALVSRWHASAPLAQAVAV